MHIDEATVRAHSTAAGAYSIEPLAVVCPRHEADCSELVRFASEASIPLTARGAGTGMGGHNVGSGLVIDFTKFMNQRLGEVGPEPGGAGTGLVRVQPGVVRDTLNRGIAETGTFFAPDPSSSARCTVGGMIANNAGGLRTLRYGSTREHVERVRWIGFDGEVHEIAKDRPLPPAVASAAEAIRSERPTIEREPPGPRKYASGYDVWGFLRTGDPTRLVCGSEGTIGILTEAVVRTERLPASTGTLVVGVRSLDAAEIALATILEHRPTMAEMIDGTLLRATRAVGLDFGIDVPTEADALFLVEVDGASRDEVHERLDELSRAMRTEDIDPCLCRVATEVEEQERLFGVRRSTSSILSRREDVRTLQIVEDVGVNPGNVVEYARRIRSICQRLDLEVVVFGHAGNGNLHVNPFFDVSRPDWREQVRALADEVTEVVRDLGGTLTAEHGDGRVRAPYLERRFPGLMPLFRRIKRELDPEGIFNPGIIVPLPGQEVTDHLKYP